MRNQSPIFTGSSQRSQSATAESVLFSQEAAVQHQSWSCVLVQASTIRIAVIKAALIVEPIWTYEPGKTMKNLDLDQATVPQTQVYADLWIAVLCAGEFVHGFASSGETILRLREPITAQRTTNIVAGGVRIWTVQNCNWKYVLLIFTITPQSVNNH